jgi:hypothetical protein
MTTIPEKMYLPEPIVISGIRVSHTVDGLKYKIEKLTQALTTATPMQLDDSARKHVTLVIENFKQHLELMEKQPITINK